MSDSCLKYHRPPSQNCTASGCADSTKKVLSLPAVLLGISLLLRFGGEWALSLFGMGWRCTPRNILNLAWMVLLIMAAWRLLRDMPPPSKRSASRPWVRLWENALVCAAAAAILVTTLLIIPAYSQTYWDEWVLIQDGQSVVISSNGHGSVGERKAFLPINGLIHGRELEYDWRTSTVTLPDGRAVSMY